MLVAAALTVPTAHADQAPTFDAHQLTAAADAVNSADVAGTAWYVDKSTNTLVVTADSTVTQAQISRIKSRAGANAGAVRVERTMRHVQQAPQGR